MKNNLNLKNKIYSAVFIAFFIVFATPSLVNASWSTGNYYTPSSSSYSGSTGNYYTPSSYSGSTGNYYSPSSYNYSGTTGNYYSPSSYNYSGTTGNYYTPSRSTTNAYTYGCTGRNCSGSNYNYGSSLTSAARAYLPQSSGCSGSGCSGGSVGGALGLNLNYSDNDTIITDNSRTNNSVRTNIRNSSTTINTTNSCSNVGSASSTGNCNSNTVNNYVAVNDNDKDDDLDIICRVSDTSIDEGDTVKFSVEIRGGRPDFRIEWDGDISGDDDEERVRFNRSGTYRVSVEVRDANGDRASDDCAVVRVKDEDDDDDDRRITVTTGTNLGTPTGNLASLDSVFLSQVPYTGPADVAKALGIIALIAVWSTVAAAYLKKKRALNSVSNKIASFKEQNKNANKIA